MSDVRYRYAPLTEIEITILNLARRIGIEKTLTLLQNEMQEPSVKDKKDNYNYIQTLITNLEKRVEVLEGKKERQPINLEMMGVGIFPSRVENVKFLLDNKSWGPVRYPRRKIEYLALYVGDPVRSVRYYGKIKQIESATSKGFVLSEKDKNKCFIDLQSIIELPDPVPLEKSDRIQSMMYSTYGKLMSAKHTKDLRINRSVLPRATY